MTTETPVKPADVAAHARPGAATKPTAKKDPDQGKERLSRKTTAKKRAKAKKPTAPAKSKTEIITTLVGRKQGASLAEIMAATDWQAHSVRGFLSLARSRRGLKITSAKNDRGVRVYRLATRKGK